MMAIGSQIHPMPPGIIGDFYKIRSAGPLSGCFGRGFSGSLVISVVTSTTYPEIPENPIFLFIPFHGLILIGWDVRSHFPEDGYGLGFGR